MARCKDCLHYDACSAFSKIINAARDVEQGCEHFKDCTNYQEVVRCKDCKYFLKSKDGVLKYCTVCGRRNPVEDEYFCSYGERRTDE